MTAECSETMAKITNDGCGMIMMDDIDGEISMEWYQWNDMAGMIDGTISIDW